MSDSILSHGEQAIASMLADGMSLEEIAEERGAPPETVEKSIDRIREKTVRAFTTLSESPFTDELVADLDDETREELSKAFGR
jgi:DNA-directed RNA polymerase specialized sigma24 family protein